MITRRLTPVAVLLAAVLVMGAGVAKAETVRIAVPDSVTIAGPHTIRLKGSLDA